MKGLRTFSLMVVISTALTAYTQAQGTGTTPQEQPNANNNQPKTQQMATSGTIKVLSPKVNEKIGSSIVTLQFELTNTGMAPDPSPTYRVQLDGRDSLETNSTEHSFTGLAPGEHTITVELVDANHTPVSGSQTTVTFKTFEPGQEGTKEKPSSSLEGAPLAPPVVKAKWHLPQGAPTDQLPAAGGELPLLSMVGFGVLVGGVISAMRTRK